MRAYIYDVDERYRMTIWEEGLSWWVQLLQRNSDGYASLNDPEGFPSRNEAFHFALTLMLHTGAELGLQHGS